MITAAEHWRTLDSRGQVMPWYTRDCCAWLETLDLRGKRVFEYGCGQSTIWYREQGAIVDGVDSNPEWAKMAGVPCKPGMTEYIDSIFDHRPFDLVCIDGIYRDECFSSALAHLQKNGAIVIDNFEQPSVQSDWPITRSIIKAVNLNLKVLKEPTHPDWQTAVITR